MSLLEVKDLSISFSSRAGRVHAVNNVALLIDEGQLLGVAGESGCGKTTTSLSIPRLLPENASVDGGEILFGGEDLLKKSEKEMRDVRWKQISVIFQGAMNALNPLTPVGRQIIEPILIHEQKISRAEAEERGKELLERVGISSKRFRDYPHEFSGGMRQRVNIAMSLSCRPRLVIADEPVTALDVMIQAQILELLRDLSKSYNLSMIMISHDLSVLSELCDKIAVMYAGRVVEHGFCKDVFKYPKHPYTARLLNAYPNIHGKRGEISGIPGNPPNLLAKSRGCPFYDRCLARGDICLEEAPELKGGKDGHLASCHMVQ